MPRSSSTIYVHGGRSIEFSRYHPQNSNSIELRVTDVNGSIIEITVFGLPAEEIWKLTNGFGDALTIVSDEQHAAACVESAEMAP